jgi:matrixin
MMSRFVGIWRRRSDAAALRSIGHPPETPAREDERFIGFSIPAANQATLALSSRHMSRHAFRIAAIKTVLILIIIALHTVRASSWQSTMPRTLDAKDPITYFIADGTGQTGYRSSDRELALWALEAWQRSAAKSLRLVAVTESKALVRLYWAEPNGGEYGEMRPLIVGGQRGAAVFIRPDVESLGHDIARRARGDLLLRDTIVYLTCLHELGHALGLEHTRDFRDIMYYFGYGGDVVEYFSRYRAQLRSRNDIAAVSGLSDADVSHIKAIYSRE